MLLIFTTNIGQNEYMKAANIPKHIPSPGISAQDTILIPQTIFPNYNYVI